MYISGIPKPWKGIVRRGQQPILPPSVPVDTHSNYPVLFIDLNASLKTPENEEIAISVSANVADHDREFLIFYDQDVEGGFLGTFFLSTRIKADLPQ